MKRAIVFVLILSIVLPIISGCYVPRYIDRFYIPEYIEEFKDTDYTVQRDAALKLAEIGKPAIPALINALEDKDENVRANAAYALGLIGPDAGKAVDKLIVLIQDDKPVARARAAFALGKIGGNGEQLVPFLIAAMDDEDYWVRTHATIALGELGPEASEAVEDLVDRMTDNEVFSISYAFKSVVKIGETAIPKLVDIVATGDEDQRKVARQCLQEIGGSAAKQLAQRIQNLGLENSEHLLEAITRLYEDAIPHLIALVECMDPNKTQPVFTALSRIGQPSLESLIRLLNSNYDLIRKNAGTAIMEICHHCIDDHDSVCRTILINALNDDSSLVGIWASSILISYSNEDTQRAFQIFTDGFENPDYRIRRDATSILENVILNTSEMKGLAPLIIGATQDEDWQVRRNALRFIAISSYSGMYEEAISTLNHALDDKQDEVRFEAALGLPYFDQTSNAKETIIEALGCSDTYYPRRALYVLGEYYATQDVLPYVISALKFDSCDVKLAAIGALYKFENGLQQAIDELIILLNDKCGYFPVTAAYALGQLGPEVSDALPALRELARNVEDNTEKLIIDEAIAKIEGTFDEE